MLSGMNASWNTRRAALLACALLPLLPEPALATQSRGTSWPFGSTTAGRGRDLYNLGLIGAKASDAVRGEPEASSGGSFQVDPDARFDDDGPEELRVELLLSGGPAELAGLAIGDVIVGVGTRNFDGGSFEDLAEGLGKATAKDGELRLRVRRGGEGNIERVELTVPVLGRELSKPTDADARAILGARALEWLAGVQEEDGGFPETLSGKNGAVVQTCIAGLAWLAGGSSLEEGAYAENLSGALSFVRSFLDAPVGTGGGPFRRIRSRCSPAPWGAAVAQRPWQPPRERGRSPGAQARSPPRPCRPRCTQPGAGSRRAPQPPREVSPTGPRR